MQKWILIFLLSISSTSLKAQFFIGGAHVNLGIPTGRLKSEVDKTLFPTLSGIVLYEFYNQPFQIGMEIGYGVYGTQVVKRNDFYPGLNEEFRLRRNNNYLSGMAVFRFLPSKSSRLTPYLEMQVGANYLYSRYKIRPSIFEEKVEVNKDMEDWGLGYKVGGGLLIPIPGSDFIKLDLRINYQDGDLMHFLTRKDTEYNPSKGNGEFEYTPRNSPLQLINASIGIVVYDAFR